MCNRLSRRLLHFPSSRSLPTCQGGEHLLFCCLSTLAEYSFSSHHIAADALQQQPSHHASRHGPVYMPRPRVTSTACTDITKRLKRQSTTVVATWYVGRQASSTEDPNTQVPSTQKNPKTLDLNLASPCPPAFHVAKKCRTRTQCAISNIKMSQTSTHTVPWFIKTSGHPHNNLRNYVNTLNETTKPTSSLTHSAEYRQYLR